jgi:hypothetical protein
MKFKVIAIIVVVVVLLVSFAIGSAIRNSEGDPQTTEQVQ